MSAQATRLAAQFVFFGAAFFPALGALMPLQDVSEQPVPLPFILDAYALDESDGAQIERAQIASAVAANRIREICFMTDLPLG